MSVMAILRHLRTMPLSGGGSDSLTVSGQLASEVYGQQLGAEVADLNPVRQTLSHSSSRKDKSDLSLRAPTRLYARRQ
jgi:hypothetical protein